MISNSPTPSRVRMVPADPDAAFREDVLQLLTRLDLEPALRPPNAEAPLSTSSVELDLGPVADRERQDLEHPPDTLPGRVGEGKVTLQTGPLGGERLERVGEGAPTRMCREVDEGSPSNPNAAEAR